MEIMKFYKGKKVLVTGHTGFKGAWLSKILLEAGAEVIGYSLEPNTEPSLFKILDLEKKLNSIIGDIADLEKLKKVFEEYKPEIVFHLAAQPIVLDSYKEPVYTYMTNVMGTVNLLECVRETKSGKSVINVTTDKVYENMEWEWGYRENERLNGYDPYSNSKSCSELVTHSYKVSFFNDTKVAVSTARAGNVIGGGDFANFRIIPDCVRAMKNNEIIEIRNPNSTRPYQHVLEPLFAYLLIAKMQYEDFGYSSSYNIGPSEEDCVTTEELVKIFCEKWSDGANWKVINFDAPHEANFLKLDCSKMKKVFKWENKWNIERAIEETVKWSKAYFNKDDMNKIVEKQIKDFVEGV